MKAKFLDVTTYDSDGWSHSTETHALSQSQGYDLISQAIRQLDRFHHPFLVIRHSDYEDSDYMSIMGGDGAFHIEVDWPDFERFVDYIDLQASPEFVDVWTSDQGASVPGYHVCHDIQKVILIAQEYAGGHRLWEHVAWLIREGA